MARSGDDSEWTKEAKEMLFKNKSISRRDFVWSSVAMGGALSLTTTKTLSAQQTADTKVSKSYEYVYEHTPDGVDIPTLIKLSDKSGFKDLKSIKTNTQTTTEPTVAAHASLTPKQVETVLDIGPVTNLFFSPGSNPWWLLEHYPDGIFPKPHDSVDFIDYRQMVDGITKLEDEYSDRLDFYSIGTSPGWYNNFEKQIDRKDIYFVEITNNINNESEFKEKEKVLYYLSMHGDERPGAEAGTRFIERLINGEKPEIEKLLNDIVLIFAYPNPDGWVARHPQYASDWVTEDMETANTFTRVQGAGVDPNRQYPAVGWIDPEHNPAEPWGANLNDDMSGIDDDVPDRYKKIAPGPLSLIEHIRNYENINYGVDLHGMGFSEDFMLTTFENGEFTYDELHDMNELQSTLNRNLVENVRPKVEENCDRIRDLAKNIQKSEGLDETPPVPKELNEYGTEFDTLEYATSGASLSWMLPSEDRGGVDLIGMTGEMALGATIGAKRDFRPDIIELQVAGYSEYIRTLAKHSTKKVDTSIEANGASTAYVTTDSLTRTSDDLPYIDSGLEPPATAETTVETASVKPDESSTVTLNVPDDATHSLYIHLQLQSGTLVNATLKNPSGIEVRSYTSHTDPEAFRNWVLQNIEPGEWTVEFVNQSVNKQSKVSVRMTTLHSNEESQGIKFSPDPSVVLGYDQKEYNVSPFKFFESLSEDTVETHDTPYQSVSIDDIRTGALVKDGNPCYDNLIIIHDDGRDDSEYVAAVDEFVANGGNLIVTDQGIHLLPVLNNDLVKELGKNDIIDASGAFVDSHFLDNKNSDHPLLENTRPNQIETWKLPNMGYTPTDDARMTLINRGAFEAAGGSVAAITNENVAVGSISKNNGEDCGCREAGIKVIGSLLPPASQANLHPFGLDDHSVTLLGVTLLINALGYQQNRHVNRKRVDFPNVPETSLLCEAPGTESEKS